MSKTVFIVLSCIILGVGLINLVMNWVDLRKVRRRCEKTKSITHDPWSDGYKDEKKNG